jgi:hypothetical protein
MRAKAEVYNGETRSRFDVIAINDLDLDLNIKRMRE